MENDGKTEKSDFRHETLKKRKKLNLLSSYSAKDA